MFDLSTFSRVPFHFWTLVFFVFGSMWGSFLNVCIYRLPRGESVVSPPSHCPHCNYSIPWYLNIPLFTWVFLRGRCANCRAPISSRYFFVELLTGVTFAALWLRFGATSPGVALAYCVLLAGFIAATFIDFEHFIIPDEITIGGTIAGLICSALLPQLHGETTVWGGLMKSAMGAAAGAGIVYGVVRGGKLLFGKKQFELPEETRVRFTESSLELPDRTIPYEEMFHRASDAVTLEARTVELPDRCYWNVSVRLLANRLEIGEDHFDPEQVPSMEVVTGKIVVPQEAMGLGDVKFMAAIGAFLGWQASIFSLMASSMIGATVGIALIAMKKHEWSSRLPYGPYIAAAATLWIFYGQQVLDFVFPGR